jgi:hypothetical protein
MVLKLKFEVLEQGYEGQTYYDNLTLEHPNEQTVKIAKAQLKRIAIACGHPNPDHVEMSEDLHNLPLMVKLNRVRGRNPSFCDENGYENNAIAYNSVASRKVGAGDTQTTAAPVNEDIPF